MAEVEETESVPVEEQELEGESGVPMRDAPAGSIATMLEKNFEWLYPDNPVNSELDLNSVVCVV